VARFHTHRHVLVVGVAAVLGLATTSCSSHRSAYCQVLDRGEAGFSSSNVDAQLHALDRVIAALPPRDRGDIQAVRDFIAIASRSSPASPQQKAEILVRYAHAIESLDPRLRDECGVPLKVRKPTTRGATG
jgi:hypothetical protein